MKGIDIRVILASYNESGTVPSSSMFWKSLKEGLKSLFKCAVEVASDATCSLAFLCWEVLIPESKLISRLVEKSDCGAGLRKARPTPWGALGGIHMPVTVVPWWGQAFKPFRDSLLDMGFPGEDVFLGRTASAAGGTRRILVVHVIAAI